MNLVYQKQPNGPKTGEAFYRFLNIHSCTQCMKILRFPLTHLQDCMIYVLTATESCKKSLLYHNQNLILFCKNLQNP